MKLENQEELATTQKTFDATVACDNARTAGPINATEITRGAWPSFCRWVTENLSGVVTTIVRDEGPDRCVLECLEHPLESIEPVLMANGVNALAVTVRINGMAHLFEVPAPAWLRLHSNSAGFATVLEIGYEQGKLTLRFSGPPPIAAGFSSNSWGE